MILPKCFTSRKYNPVYSGWITIVTYTKLYINSLASTVVT